MSRSTLIDRPALEELLETIGLVPLSSPSLTTVFERMRVADRSFPDSKLAFRGEASVDATVFNDLSDEDDHRVLRVAPKRRLTTSLEPQIVLDTDHAWIRYRTNGEITAKDKKTLDDLKFSIEGRSGITLLDYRRHDPDTLLAEAVTSDLKQPRSVFRARDVRKLEPGEALALGTRARLRASVTVSQADIYTNTLARLTALLGGHARIAIRVDSRATITVPLSIEDDFLLSFARTEEGEIRIGVRTESDRRRGTRLRISASAKLAKRKELAQAVTDFLTGFLGAPLERLREILGKATLEDLDDDEREIIERLLEQLGLSDEMEDLEELRDELDSLEKRATEIFLDVLSHRIETSFQYEYSRLESEDDLLNVVVRREGLAEDSYARLIRKHHRALVRGDMKPLLDAIRNDDEGRYVVQQYLDRDRVVAAHSFGFTLGIGSWKFRSKETTKLATITHTDLEDRRRIAFKGLRRHEDRTGSFDSMEWYVDFRAEMSDWVAEPRAADFEFGLHFFAEWQIDRFSKKSFLPLLDMAVLWDALASTDLEWALQQVTSLFGSRRLTARLQMMFEEDDLRRIMARVESDDHGRLTRSLAAALPFSPDYPLLATPHSRAIAYEDLIAAIIDGREMSDPELHRAASAIAAELGEPALAGRERDASTGGAAGAKLPGTVIALHPKLSRDWLRFTDGARLFSDALTTGTMHHARIPEIFGDLHHMWDHAWYVRALPAWLLTLAAEAGVAEDVQRTFRIDSGDGDTLHLMRSR